MFFCIFLQKINNIFCIFAKNEKRKQFPSIIITFMHSTTFWNFKLNLGIELGYQTIILFLYIAAVVVATHSCIVEFENLKFHEEAAEVYQNSK